MKKVVKSSGGFPISNSITHNAKYTMELGGQIGFNPKTNKLDEGIEAQTRNTMDAIKEGLAVNGWTMDNIVKARVFLVDMNDYAKMNEVYASYFPNNYFPTRFGLSVVELPAGALVEIECTAVGDEIKTSE